MLFSLSCFTCLLLHKLSLKSVRSTVPKVTVISQQDSMRILGPLLRLRILPRWTGLPSLEHYRCTLVLEKYGHNPQKSRVLSVAGAHLSTVAHNCTGWRDVKYFKRLVIIVFGKV